MAWRPERLLQSGELVNTQRGWTIGWLQLDGFGERLQFKLAGNCHPDLAGWKFRIHRIEPELSGDEIRGDEDAPPDYSSISLDQSGHHWDIGPSYGTADPLEAICECPIERLDEFHNSSSCKISHTR